MKARVTERRSTLLIAVVWIVAVVLSSPILVYRRQFVRPWLDHIEIWCDDTWPPVSLQSMTFLAAVLTLQQYSGMVISLALS